jgi:hypothetical protein
VKTVLFAATTVTEISFATGRTGRHYLCAGEDDQSGEYVRADVAEGLLAALKEVICGLPERSPLRPIAFAAIAAAEEGGAA